jgi:hypothetical protein
MKHINLLTASLTILGTLIASPAVQAHASLNAGGTGANPVWTNGAITPWLPNDATVSSIGYLGIHSISNKRVIQTGVYGTAYNATTNPGGVTTANLGGTFGGATPVVGDSLLGQTYKYNNNAANPTDLALTSISTGANSWAAGVSDTNTGLSFGNMHVSSGTGNPEGNLMPTVNYLNITVGDDPLFAGIGQLAFSLYQGWAQGPGLLGMNLLGTVTASSIGQDIGLSLALSGLTRNAPGTEGEYTIVVGDQSAVGGQYRMALEASLTNRYSNIVTASAVPVPGAIWLFGSALVGLVGYGRRKAAIQA